MTALFLSAYSYSAFDPFHFLIGFLFMICIIAILIIAAKWLLTLSGVTIPQPLLVILGIIVFMILLVVVLRYAGLALF